MQATTTSMRVSGGACTPRSQTRPCSGRRLAPCTRAVPPPAADKAVDKGFSLLEWSNKVLPQSQLVAGVKTGWRFAWQTMVKELAPQSKDGAYKRPSYKFTGRVGDAQFPAESGRYHLYAGNACPWCHRALLVMVLRGLLRPSDPASTPSAPSSSSTSGAVITAHTGRGPKTHVSFTTLVDDPTRARRGGWVFDAGKGVVDPVWGAQDLWQVYDTASPGFRGRCTAPLLVDARGKRIVSNESADLVRMLNALHLPGCTDVDLAPAHLLPQIDALNDKIYDSVNNGVYRSGFATTQSAYDAVQREMYGVLDELEARLSDSRFLLGDKLTEADVRLFPTVVRFDAVYAHIFKCSRKRMADYPNLSGWMRDMWQIQVPGSTLQVSGTVDIDAARNSYYTNLFPLNPSGIIPSGPTFHDLKLDAPHGRGNSSALQDVCWSRVA
uniref:GST C-terminal domain-containing protein n=1 Tax=Chlamydomonas leiostraca TaxID=1034604 RepID=A0A7S0WJ40_9CHLO|mmetsp:Transcript_15257/g.38035  ORF Transcript_15257/g.38035 Transcript_15257/m.38035 type:complete len:439 (+) Transcript_15257:52-1368(+)